jgi:hypothetical protein
MRYESGMDTLTARVALPLARSRAVTAAEPTDEVVARELLRSEETLSILRRLGVEESQTLPLSFVFETGGPAADAELAFFLKREAGYEVTIEPEGVSGLTKPIEMSSETLDHWVRAMLRVGSWCGGCAFGGWTVAISRA